MEMQICLLMYRAISQVTYSLQLNSISFFRTKWYNNPFTRGTYTYDNLDTPKHPHIREQLSQPLLDAAGEPRVLIAGEATNAKHYGTVHGAVETGIREANRLLGEDKITL